ncbi:alkylhydroperoxidase AhpD family core domain protein [Necator americanus]|uniref:Alkylhydroperoxidase AhpD family core domain protein n=1 Tax=Necator americanus TaxID=51031 RepID=W2TDT7_NECAM|nr:alkylhydroperoxidase AhpD family core domain protein [Necator americanus]ETN79341.1 alkylhydroperoxidase AhpD family core domain protein [Necator americanus]
MYRYPNFDPNVFTPRQLEVYERIASGQRKAVTGPLRIWLHNPELADLAQALGEYCRFGSALPPRLSELAIVTTAAHWRSGYEWAAHERHALNAGVSGDALCAIAANRAPSFVAN